MTNKKTVTMLVGVTLSLIITFHQSIAGSHKNSHRVKNSEYNNALRIMWTKVYANQGITLYCAKPFSTKSRQARKKDQVNAEHVFPMSWVAKDLGCGTRKQCQAKSTKFREIESDLHNIYPTQTHVNKARSNYRFGDISGEKRLFGQCDFEVNPKKRVAEPTPKVRGEVARAMLYLAYQYNLSLHRKTETLMKKWDREDPPDTEEKRREKIIQREQGRENPFITQYPFN